MTCESFDARLDALLDGRCTTADWAEAESHLAGCLRCRRLFDAVSGRGDDLEDEQHESLATAIVAKTSGGDRACASARERLCGFVDDDLGKLDRELVQGHLAHCRACSALAAGIAEQTRVLATFATLAPRTGIAWRVVAATSRKPATPTATEKIAAWLARAAQRPRFAVEVAYVMTLLLLVAFGNPVDAFREASVRVQPRVSVVAGAVSRPLGEMRAAGAERLTRVEQALSGPAAGAETSNDGLLGGALRWVRATLVDPFESLALQVRAWAKQAHAQIRAAFAATTEPAPPPAR